MKYGEFLKPGGTIGLVAPSFGVSGSPYSERFENAKRTFSELGYSFKEVASIRNLINARSNTGQQRAQEFTNMWLDTKADFLFSVAGGELMCEILPYLDFDVFRNSRPKWFMGYSDNTILTFLLTTICGIATIYGMVFGEYGMKEWDPSLREGYEIITGQRSVQHSYDRYEIESRRSEESNALCSYNKTKPVVYRTLDGQDVEVTGRLIGGCLDVLVHLCGTPYDHVKDFVRNYRNDGIIWYLEACDLNPLMCTRALWQLRENGWFENCTAIVFGRPMHDQEVLFDVTFDEAVRSTLEALNVPIILDMDFGHLPPSFTIVNGAVATISTRQNKGTIHYQFK